MCVWKNDDRLENKTKQKTQFPKISKESPISHDNIDAPFLEASRFQMILEFVIPKRNRADIDRILLTV